MIIFPAIDIRNGKCVRLFQGKLEKETIYNDDPLFTAKEWEKRGAGFLHLVDLDGAFTGNPLNKRIIKDIIKGVNIPVQIGGGIRTIENAKEIIEMGAERIIVGTSAVKDYDFVKKLVKQYENKIVVSIDARDGLVFMDGWVKNSDVEAVVFARDLEEIGVKTIVYTDISKDGTMIGPNYYELKRLKENIGIDIIASGGIGRKKDVEELESLGLYGAIIGRALYENKIKLEEII